jgi:PqqD family protein of HPr-rel-A system
LAVRRNPTVYDNLALSDSGFLFDTRTGATYSLSKTGTFLLRALMGGAQVQSLSERISEEFDVDQRLAARDAEQFLIRLREMRLITVSHLEGTR